MKQVSPFRFTRKVKYNVAVLATILLSSVYAPAANIAVDIELSLVVDVSGSVDTSEYNLQMQGYASAFESGQIHTAVLNTTNGMAVNLIQFSSSAAESVPWTILTDSISANAFAAQIRNATRLFSSGTTIDSGIDAASQSIAGNGYEGAKKIILVSGDGGGSSGVARDNALASGVTTISGIVISDPSGNLKQTYEQSVVGGDNPTVASAASFQDFEPEVLRLLTQQITGISDDGLPVLATLRQSQITLARAGLRDVNSRLFRLRTRRPPMAPVAAIPSSDKEGTDSPKGIVAIPPEPKRWEAFGSMHFLREDVDGDTTTIPGSTLRIPTLADYEIDIYGGTAGIEYRLTDQWSLGAAIISNCADIDMGMYGDIESDGGALALYASFYLEEAFGGPGDLYADLLYSYGVYDNEIRRNTGGGIARGKTDSENHTIELNVGYKLRQSDWIHGPYTSINWTDGELDGFTEKGAGTATFPSLQYDSLLGEIGYQVAKVLSTSRGNFVPQARLAWEHEFKNDTTYIGNMPLAGIDDDRIAVGIALAWEFAENSQAIIDYEGRFSSSRDAHQINIRVAFQF